jgi:hypothetical protein
VSSSFLELFGNRAPGSATSQPLYAMPAMRLLRPNLHDYPGTKGGIDFLQQQQAPAGCTCIVTNPPFRIANQFVAHALDLCPIVVIY